MRIIDGQVVPSSWPTGSALQNDQKLVVFRPDLRAFLERSTPHSSGLFDPLSLIGRRARLGVEVAAKPPSSTGNASPQTRTCTSLHSLSVDQEGPNATRPCDFPALRP